MVDAGIKTDDHVIDIYNKMKMDKGLKYIICKIDKEVVIETEGGKDATYSEFLALLPDDSPRYCVFDFNFKHKDGRDINKLVFIFWCPDNSNVKLKMTYATAKESFKKKLVGIARYYEVQDKSLIDEKQLIEDFSK